MRWLPAALPLILSVAALACADGGDAGPSAGLPAGLPESAEPMQTAEERPAEVAPGEGGRLFFSSDCVDGLLSVTTTREIVYAELPCDRALPPEVKERFLGKAVALRIVPGQQSKLYIESQEAGSVEFTVGRMWLVEQ